MSRSHFGLCFQLVIGHYSDRFKNPNQTQSLDSHIRILRDFKKCQSIFQIHSTAVSADSIVRGCHACQSPHDSLIQWQEHPSNDPLLLYSRYRSQRCQQSECSAMYVRSAINFDESRKLLVSWQCTRIISLLANIC